MKKKENKKKIKLEIDLDRLEKIANYYGFPLAMFWAPKKIFKKGKTREQVLLRISEAFDKIRDIVEEIEQYKKK